MFLSPPAGSALPPYARGNLIIGGVATWESLPVGGALQVLTNDGVDVFWSGGMLDIAAGKTLTVSNDLTLVGTDGKGLALIGDLIIGADTIITGGGTIGLGGFTLTVPKTGTAVVGTGLAGRVAEWVGDANTVHESTLIKGGAGVLTLTSAGAFNITAPATGTIALLEIANVFTATQTIQVATATDEALILKTTDDDPTENLLETQDSGGNPFITIDGEHQMLLVASAATKIPFTAQAAAAQSANLFEVKDSGGNVLGGAQARGTIFCDLDTDVSNIFLAQGAGNTSASGVDNTVIGYLAGTALTSGYNNTLIGRWAGRDLTEGFANVCIGRAAGLSLTTGVSNLFLGTQAGFVTTTGESNTFIGANAGVDNIDGYNNVFIGQRAGQNNTSGNSSVAIGSNALNDITTGLKCVAIGVSALENTTRNFSVGIGHQAGNFNVTGAGNIYMGYQAGFGSGGQSNEHNVIIGYQAGFAITTGSDNIWIGYLAGSTLTTESNTLVIANTNTTTPLIYGEFDGVGNVGLKTWVPAAAAVGFTIVGAAAQTANLFELQESDGSIMLASGDGLGGSVFSGNVQLEDIDFVWAGDTEANLFRIDAGLDAVHLGDWDTNYVAFALNGDQTFTGTAGFYPRRISQSAEPGSGVGATQIDTGELIVWRDPDDSKTYLVYNDTNEGVRLAEMV